MVRLGRAMTHPLRLEILAALYSNDDLSPSQLTRHVDASYSLSLVAYHTRYLFDNGIIRLARTEPRRGAIEHFYALHKDFRSALDDTFAMFNPPAADAEAEGHDPAI
jgi:DNA-binding transcriptional ArsR family regulator